MRSYGTLGNDAFPVSKRIELNLHSKKSMKMIAGISLAFSAVCGSLVVYQQRHDHARVEAPTGLDASIASISELPNSFKSSVPTMSDAYGVIHAFGKWTFTSVSEAAAIRNTEGMWRGFNHYILDRNQSNWPKFQEVGPTSCSVTDRKWTAMRYSIGDNNIHWVHDEAKTNPLDGDITVKDMHKYLRGLHGNLSNINQFSDFRWSSAAFEIKPYVVMAKEVSEIFGWPYRFIKAKTDIAGHSAYIVRMVTEDGNLMETVSVSEPDEATKALFDVDDCLYYPMKDYNATSDKNCTTSNSDATHCMFFDYNSESSGLMKLGNYISIRKDPYNSSLPLTFPVHTHIASSDPDKDAEFFLRYFGNSSFMETFGVSESEAVSMGAAVDVTEDEALAGLDSDTCGLKSRWIKMGIYKSTNEYFPNYLHFSYHPDAAYDQVNGKDMPLTEWENYQRKIRSNMQNNTYDRFMDDHIGIDTTEHFLGTLAMKLFEDGEQVLTRREPIPTDPNYYFTMGGMEKISAFFKFPASQYTVQVSYAGATQNIFTEKYGWPEICDWDFCPEFYNYRVEDKEFTTEGKLTSGKECGFTATAFLESRRR